MTLVGKTDLEKKWISYYQAHKAIWLHDGNPKRPHSLLTSGDHSNGFANSSEVMQDPVMLEAAGRNLVSEVEPRMLAAMKDPASIVRVVGPAMGAVTLASEMARLFTLKYGEQVFDDGAYTCLSTFAEKKDGQFVLRNQLKKGEWVLVVEDVLTTGGSVEKVIEVVEQAGGVVVPVVAVLVNWSDLRTLGDRRVVSLINQPMPKWKPSDCPLCAQGSEAIRPKGENWAKLNAEY